MAVLTPDLFWLTAEELLDCVCAALTEESECGCPCRAGVVVGAPAWDDCCEGSLNVWMERPYFHDIFPAQTSAAVVCSTPLAGEFAIQLLRCAPTIKDDGSAPTADELSESARLMYQDMYITLRALSCCLAQSKRDRLYTIRESNFVGPEGGCVGFQIRLTIQLNDPKPNL